MKRKLLGPLYIPVDYPIEPAGFRCKDCGQKVRRAKLVVPLAVRAILYSCRCGSVMCWEDESQPGSSDHWRMNVQLMRASGADLVTFCGSDAIKPGFQGRQ